MRAPTHVVIFSVGLLMVAALKLGAKTYPQFLKTSVELLFKGFSEELIRRAAAGINLKQ